MADKIEWHPQGTPGPWTAHEWSYAQRTRFDDKGQKYWGIKSEYVPYDEVSGWTSDANARAIAEVPAMVQALRKVAELTALNKCWDDVRAILARIDGEGQA